MGLLVSVIPAATALFEELIIDNQMVANENICNFLPGSFEKYFFPEQEFFVSNWQSSAC